MDGLSSTAEGSWWPTRTRILRAARVEPHSDIDSTWVAWVAWGTCCSASPWTRPVACFTPTFHCGRLPSKVDPIDGGRFPFRSNVQRAYDTLFRLFFLRTRTSILLPYIYISHISSPFVPPEACTFGWMRAYFFRGAATGRRGDTAARGINGAASTFSLP